MQKPSRNKHLIDILRNIAKSIYKKAIFLRRNTLYKCERKRKREKKMQPFVINPASIYAATSKALSNSDNQPKRKTYTSLNTMLEECYLVGATRFGHNFIA